MCAQGDKLEDGRCCNFLFFYFLIAVIHMYRLFVYLVFVLLYHHLENIKIHNPCLCVEKT